MEFDKSTIFDLKKSKLIKKLINDYIRQKETEKERLINPKKTDPSTYVEQK